MSYQTAWTKKASSLPSDRIPPRKTTPKPKAKNSGSAIPTNTPIPKSKEVKKLEILKHGLQALVSRGGVPEKDPRGGCFCQARSHSLSFYTPACTQCGLPLCMLNFPMYCCPSCNSPLLSPPSLQVLLTRISSELDETLRKEEEERQRVEAERQREAGGFPTLGAATSGSNIAGTAQQQTHKVMSLTGSRITVSRLRATPPSSGPASRAVSPDLEADLPKRVPQPSNEVPVSSIPPQTLSSRPWFNARESVAYVEPARI